MWSAELCRALIALYMVIVNLVAFVAMGVDKRRARRHQWRIRERTLLLLAALGGSLGAWAGMAVFRHKTRHNRFRFGVPALLMAQLALAIWLLCR